jgi:hypothetical protein
VLAFRDAAVDGEPEIDKLDAMSIHVHDNVFGLEVAVDDVSGVYVPKRFDNVPGDLFFIGTAHVVVVDVLKEVDPTSLSRTRHMNRFSFETLCPMSLGTFG